MEFVIHRFFIVFCFVDMELHSSMYCNIDSSKVFLFPLKFSLFLIKLVLYYRTLAAHITDFLFLNR